jgi:hypothetical protein
MPDTRQQPAIVDFWEAFELEDEALEPEPEPGDFWGEPDDDRRSGD